MVHGMTVQAYSVRLRLASKRKYYESTNSRACSELLQGGWTSC